MQAEPYACWVDQDGAIACSGLDGAEQGWSPPPTADASTIACGDGFACAQLLDGTVECWGTLFETPDPGAVEYATLSCAEETCCGTLLDGTPTCFDDVGLSLPGTYAQLCLVEGVLCGRTESGTIDCDFEATGSVVQETPTADDFVELGCGRTSACGISEDGVVECWGRAEVSR